MIHLTIKNKYASSSVFRKMVRFFIAFFGAVIGAILVNDFPLFKNMIKVSEIDTWLVKTNISALKGIFQHIGYATRNFNNVFGIIGSEGIRLEYGCLAIRQLCQFCFFSLIYFGTWKFKVWYLPFGIFILLVVNLLRLFLIELVQFHQWTSFDFIHTTSSLILFNITIFMLWIYQVNLQQERRK